VDEPYIVDPERKRECKGDTGIYVRAQQEDGKWVAADILHLTTESLLRWLRSRGGENKMAEDVVGILLGHGHLHEHVEAP